jgi:hypothetical protein
LIAKLVADYQAKREAILRERELAEAKDRDARETMQMLDDLARKQSELERRLQQWQQIETEIAAAQPGRIN